MTSLIVLDPQSTVFGRKHDVWNIQRKNQCNGSSFFNFPVDFCLGLTTVQLQCAAWDSKWPLSAILDLLSDIVDHPRRPLHDVYTVWKFHHDRLSSFQVKRIWIFWSFMLEILIQTPKNSVLRKFGTLNMICHQQYPQKAQIGVKPRVLSYKCFRSFHICDL